MVSNLVSLVVQTRGVQRNISRIQYELTARGTELTTGKKTDMVEDLGGEVRTYLDLSSVREGLVNRRERMTTGDNRLSQINIGLEQVSIQMEAYKTLTGQIGIIDKNNLRGYVNQAESTLDAVSNAMNIQWGGRYLFSGDATDQKPITDIQNLTTTVRTIINEHAAAAGGQMTTQAELDAMMTEIDTVFDDTHPDATRRFSALVYTGGSGDMPGIEMADGEVMQYDVKADAQAVRTVTKSLALLAANNTLELAVPIDDSEPLPSRLHTSYLRSATLELEGSLTQVIELRSDIGFKQDRLDKTAEGLDTIIFRYDERISLYENADQYEAGVAFTELQQQLEASFFVTSRLSQQSLIDYIR